MYFIAQVSCYLENRITSHLMYPAGVLCRSRSALQYMRMKVIASRPPATAVRFSKFCALTRLI